MKKRTASLLRMICMVLCIGMMLTGCKLTGCSNNGTTSGSASTPAGESVVYSVELVSEGGMPISGVGVWVYTDETKSDLIWYEQTNAEGKMSFSGQEGGSYVAVLEAVPAGYAVEEFYAITGQETRIVLSASMLDLDDVENVVYQMGDMIYDFTVTTPDGESYTLSELLREKSAVVLNFWYGNCAPCKNEFPYLQAAYEKYSDKLEVLAMNPVDSDPAIVGQIAEALGLTFPMALVGAEWEQMFQVVGYPTTVVIDRYGMISFIHTGSITTEGVFEALFDYYTAEDYTQGVVDDITEIVGDIDLNAGDVQGTKDDPIIDAPSVDDGGTSMSVDVAAGGVTYLEIYKISNVYATIYDEDAYFIYNGKTYEAEDGKVAVWITSDDTFSGIKLGVGNSGEEDKTFTIKFVAKKGSYGNPYALELGEFTTKISAGNEQGVYYIWTAPEEGVLTLENVSCTSGVEYGYTLYNLNSYVNRVMRSDGTGDSEDSKSFSINVKKGQRVQVIICVMPDEKYNYPAATMKSIATFTAGEVEDVVVVEQIDYSVTVTEQVDGVSQPKANVTFKVLVDGVEKTVASGADGVAILRLPAGDYTWTMVVPNYYTVEETSFALTKDAPTASVELVPVPQVDYTITVTDDAGNAMPGVDVTMNGKFLTTDDSGKVTFSSVYVGSYDVLVGEVEGYYTNALGYPTEVTEQATAMTLVLPKCYNYTVTVLDDDAAAVSGAGVTIGETTVVTDENGNAVFSLVSGSYTASLTAPEGYVVDESLTYPAEVAGADSGQTMQIKKLHSYSVTVTDVDGAVAGLEVVIDGETCVTDENGTASVLRVKGAYSYELGELPACYALESAGEALTEGVFAVPVKLAYVPVAHTVTVTDQNGAAISGISVYVDGQETALVTGEDGCVVYDRDISAHNVAVQIPDHYYGEYSYEVEKGQTELSVLLYSRADYTVRVVNGIGEPVENVQLAVTDKSALAFPEVISNTDAEGRVAFSLPASGIYEVRIVAYLGDGDYSYSTAAVPFGEGNEVTLTMGENSMYTVEVLDETGAPVNGISVQFYDGISEAPVVGDTYNGKAVFEAEKAVGYYAVVLYDESRYQLISESAHVEFGEETCASVQLHPLVDYQVKVVDQTGAGVTATITVDGNSCTAENGSLTLTLPKGEHTLAIGDVTGYRVVTAPECFDESGTAEFLLQQVADYTVSILDQDGAPVKADVVVRVGDTEQVVSNGAWTLEGLDVGSYTAVITVPEGYRAISGTSLQFDENNCAEFRLQKILTYTVSLVDHTGAVRTDLAANVTIGTTTVKAVDGVATTVLDAGSYEISVAFGGDVDCSYAPASVTEAAPEVSVLVADRHDGTLEGDFFAIDEGAYALSLTPDTTTRYILTIDEATPTGKYQFRLLCDESVAVLDFHGSSNFQYDSNTEMINNAYTTDINGGDVVMAVENVSATDVILVVTRLGDVEPPLPSESYNTDEKPLDNWMTLAGFAEGKELTAIDITVKSSYTLVKDANGFYHLNSANGPLLLVDLKMGSLDLSNLVYNAPFCAYFNDAGEQVTYAEATYKEEYNVSIREYVDFIQGGELETNPVLHFYTDAAGADRSVYPLNDELMYMLQMGCENMGWFKAGHANNLFGGAAVDEANGWMYFLVYEK